MSLANWYYIDDDGEQQGPFDSDNMKQWFDGGFFDLQTKVRNENDVQQTADANNPGN
jgi:hypothetical protein